MQLSELVALLSLAAVDDASKENDLGSVLFKAGLAQTALDTPLTLLEILKTKQSVTLTETARIIRALRLDFSPRVEADREQQVHHVTRALANGALYVPCETLILFLCFVVAIPSAHRLECAIAGLRRDGWSGRNALRVDEVLNAIPHLIAVAYAAAVLLDKSWSPTSPGFGSLTFTTTRALLKGVAEVTFDSFVDPGCRLRVSDLYSFIETCAKNLSDLMLQQTLLEQEVTRVNVHADDQPSVHLAIMQSRRLLRKYVSDPCDLEGILNEVWRKSVVGHASPEEASFGHELASVSETTTSVPGSAYNAPNDCDIPNCTAPDPVQNSTNEMQTAVPNADTNSNQQPGSCSVEQQSDLFQGIAQIVGDLGHRLVMVTFGRFLLFLALLYGTGALAFVLVRHAGFSIALSLVTVFGLTLILALVALYCAGKGCRQFGDEASRNVCHLLQGNPTTAAVNELLGENGTQGLQPVVKSVVSTLVPEKSHCSMIPVRQPIDQLNDSDDDGSPTRRRLQQRHQQAIDIKPAQQSNAVQELPSNSGEDETVAARLRGIVSTVGKIAAHFNNESHQQQQQHGEGYSRQPSANGRCPPSREASNVGSSGLELQRQSTQDKFLNAYPHMRDGSQ